uniref:E3 SUMO-protein ligase NSE2 n=2 Tax=Scleropages formosus TaxID=113540 RepID=A0A8C9RHG2_SCLFO
MSLSVVNSNLSSLKSCQADLNTGMDMVKDVALDLVESGGDEKDAKKLTELMLNLARLDAEMHCFVEAIGHITQAQRESPDTPHALRAMAENEFMKLKAGLANRDFQKHSKVVTFQQSLQSSAKQSNPLASATSMEEELDEDIAVTQSQVNFTCPLTQLEMTNPVKNKKCNHHYEQEAVLSMIKRRQNQHKKFCCPVIGCGNTSVTQSDLVPDAAMRRMIQNQKKQGTKA